MPYLALATLVWAFSFGLVATQLPAASVPPAFVAAARILTALLVFLPFITREKIALRARLQLAALGALQFGLVYVTYLEAFKTLKAHEVALLTVFTPVFVWLGGDLLSRRFHGHHLAAALLAAAGAAWVLSGRAWESERWGGIWLMQASNLAFAAGQLGFRRLKETGAFKTDTTAYAWMLAGAALLTLPWGLAVTGGQLPALSLTQWSVLLYLGSVATGLGFFWWNRGATRVGVGTLAAANNAKIPLGVLVSILFFNSHAAWLPVLCGMGLVAAAMWLGGRPFNSTK